MTLTSLKNVTAMKRRKSNYDYDEAPGVDEESERGDFGEESEGLHSLVDGQREEEFEGPHEAATPLQSSEDFEVGPVPITEELSFKDSMSFCIYSGA
jgi:hypothetical protein